MKSKIAPDKVAVYIRWSTEDQGQGHTLEIQRESCRYYCLSQGWAVREDLTFIDDGCSGSTLERPALARLRRTITAGQVDCVVVYKLDRLSRNIRDIINLVLGEWEESACVRSTQEPVDTTTDAGKMFFTMLGSFADFERSTIKSRTWSGKRKNAEKGKNPGMIYPYGLQKSEEGAWEINGAEAAVVLEVFDQYIRGKSCRLIAFALNDRGVRTRSGKMWAGADISRLLRNPLYAGRLVYNRRGFAARPKVGRVLPKGPEEVVTCTGAAPAIVDQATWDQAARIRDGRPRLGRGASARTQSSPYLLSGLLKCPCGHAWIGIQGGRNHDRFYACAGARSGGPAKCASRLIKAATLDAFVVDRVRSTWPLKGPFRAELLSRLTDQLRRREAQVSVLRERLAALEAALSRFKTDYKLGKLTAEVYTELTAEVRQEREELAGALRTAQQEVQAAAATEVDLHQAETWYRQLDAWSTLELHEQQQVLRMLIGHALVSRPKGTVDVSLHIAWKLQAPGLR